MAYRDYKTVRFGSAALILIVGALVNPVYSAEPNAARLSELDRLLSNECGACHGLTLKGGLGPALTPEALTGKSPTQLYQTIRDGRPNTPMAPWKDFLTKAETEWLVQRLLHGGVP